MRATLNRSLDLFNGACDLYVVWRLGSLFICFLTLSYSSPLFSTSLNQSQKDRIEGILKPYKNKVGVSIRSLQGLSVYEKNAGKLYTPASLAKLVSSACAFDELGPDHVFKTTFAHTGSLKKGVLNGNLVIKGGGDPSYVIENLERNAEKLFYVQGVREIKGSLLLDTSAGAQPRFKPFDGFDGDRGRAFASLLTPLAINHNAFSIWISVQDKKANLEVLPEGTIDLKNKINKLEIIPGRYRGSRMNLDFRPESLYLKVSGKFGTRDAPKTYYRAHPDPYASFALQFARVWADLGGKWNGKYKIVTSSPKATWLHTHESRALSRIFIDINKFSTNFAAEMTLMAAASQYFKKKLDPKQTDEFLKACIKRNGIKEKEMNLENGSGLSRSSKLTSDSLTRFLSHLRTKLFFPEYLSTLSVAGVDGTTRSRLENYAGQARLKTGTINGVNTIAGYVFPEEGTPYTVSLLFNCGGCSHSQMRRDQDRIIRTLLEG